MWQAVSSLSKRPKSDLLVLPYFEGRKAAGSFGKLGDLIKRVPKEDFTGKEGSSITLYESERILLLGLGKKPDEELIRRSYGEAAKAALRLKANSMTVVLPSSEWAVCAAEGIGLCNYSFDEYQKEKKGLLKKVGLVGISKKELAQVKQASTVIEGVHLARDLVNRNADDVTPAYLVSLARKLGRQHAKIKTSVFDRKRLEKEKMGLLLAVGRAAPVDPALIIMEYRGAPRSKDKTVIVGKGVTFDTGGLNLKPTGSIETMRCDMGGAATTFGILHAVAQLGLKKNITFVVPTVENSVDAASYHPGDVHVGYSGTSVEIGNTDAEGRLILADALAYAAKKLKPSRIIDFATLTGAMVIALGEETSGLMSNDDALAQGLIEAGEQSYDRVWRLPLHKEYRELLKSDIADIKSTGGRAAGSITAALFLQEFVGDVPWAHVDIAGTAYGSRARHYHPKMGTGAGVRMIMQYLITSQ